jgi:hypothetical protein
VVIGRLGHVVVLDHRSRARVTAPVARVRSAIQDGVLRRIDVRALGMRGGRSARSTTRRRRIERDRAGLTDRAALPVRASLSGRAAALDPVRTSSQAAVAGRSRPIAPTVRIGVQPPGGHHRVARPSVAHGCPCQPKP